MINHHPSINDIVNSDQHVPIGVFLLFADDTNIFVEDENEKAVYKKSNAMI